MIGFNYIPHFLSSYSTLKKFVGNDQSLQKKLFNAFTFSAIPNDTTLDKLTLAFKIPLNYDRFFSEIDQENISFMQYVKDVFVFRTNQIPINTLPTVDDKPFSIKDGNITYWTIVSGTVYIYRDERLPITYSKVGLFVISHPLERKYVGYIQLIKPSGLIEDSVSYETECTTTRTTTHDQILDYLLQNHGISKKVIKQKMQKIPLIWFV